MSRPVTVVAVGAAVHLHAPILCENIYIFMYVLYICHMYL